MNKSIRLAAIGLLVGGAVLLVAYSRWEAGRTFSTGAADRPRDTREPFDRTSAPGTVKPNPEQNPVTSRPARWAQPLQVDGVPNLHRVSDTLYRSAQPTSEGMKNLKAMGIKTVINLRTFHSDQEVIREAGLVSIGIPMVAWHAETEDAVKFLQVIRDPSKTPILVHCQHGADRTGTMCALYRITHEGWSKEEALKEMTEGGFGFHGIWDNLIQWVNAQDIEGIKKKASGK